MVDYIPQQGDIIYLDFNPQAGHEQSGTRPALVVSSSEFYKKTKMAMVCPISTNAKIFPLHIQLDDGMKTKGMVFCEHIKSLDISARNARYVEKLSDKTMEKVKSYIMACLN